MAPDDRICREDLCAQRDGGYDDKNTATGGTAHKDWSGIGRDTAYFVGYQIAVIGLLYVLPESVTGWTKEQKKSYDFDEWVKNVKSPVWDKDKLYLNYLVHPYWGATYYIRARERGFDKFESFVYSAFLSALFEYGAEALFEAPSYQDLIVTPIAGTLLGMYVFEPIRERIKAKGDQQEWYDTLALVLSDPLGAVSELTDNLFGIKSSANLVNSPAGKSRCRHDEGNLADSHRVAKSTSCRNSYMGLEVRVQW